MTFAGLRARVLSLLLAGSFLFILPSAEAAVLRVDATSPCTTGCGASWATAYPDIGTAISEAGPVDELWIRGDTYFLTTTLIIHSSLQIYGGFSGAETAREERDWVANPTVIEGGSSVRCIFMDGEDTRVVLDGVTISGGYTESGDGQYMAGNGGAIYNEEAELVIRNCTFEYNYAMDNGGALYNYSPSLSISDSTFLDNMTESGGGGALRQYFDLYASYPVIENCVFAGNQADHGGAIVSAYSSPEISGCIFRDNWAFTGGAIYDNEAPLDPGADPMVIVNSIFADNGVEGGGMALVSYHYEEPIYPIITNCTFWDGRTWGFNPLIETDHSSPTITNSIIWLGNSVDPIYDGEASVTQVRYSDVWTGSGLPYPGEGNIWANPQFVDPDNGDFHLQAGSVCIDAGTASAPSLPSTDFEGDPRIGGIAPDMGADEIGGSPAFPDIYVDLVGIDFGQIPVGAESAAVEVTVENEGSADLDLGTLALTGPGAADFELRHDTCSGQTLAPSGGSCTTEAVFLPSTAGFESAVLSIPSNDPDEPVVEVALSGEGLPWYTLTVDKLGEGTGTVTSDPAGIDCGGDCDQAYLAGTPVTLTTSTEVGTEFVEWAGAGCSGDGDCTVTMDADLMVAARFELKAYRITTIAHTGGSLTPSGDDVFVKHGADLTISVDPEEGYHVADVTIDGVSVGAVPEYTFTNVTSEHTIEAIFAINTYTITTIWSGPGMILIPGPVVVTHGDGHTFTMQANQGAHVADVSVDGVSVGAVPAYTFTNVTSDRTIEATFEWDTFTITTSQTGAGMIIPPGPVTVTYDHDQTFTMAPNANFQVEDVIVDGVSVGAVTEYTFVNVRADHDIAATFVLETYTIAASASEGGTIDPSGAVEVVHGSWQRFTFEPEEDYYLSDVTVDGVSVGVVTEYDFNNVTTDHEIHASFEPYLPEIIGGGEKDFGPITLDGISDTSRFSISNYGEGDLEIGAVTLAGAHASDFVIQSDECSGLTLPTYESPSDNCWLEVFFQPGAEGDRSAELQVASNDPETPVLVITLTGQGVTIDRCLIAVPKMGDSGIGEGIPWPEPRFTNNGDGTLTDNLTGLIWMQDAHPAQSMGVNLGSMSDYSFAMNLAGWVNSGTHPEVDCGHSDWRVPNILELESLLNYETPSGSWLASWGFTNVCSAYWSSNGGGHQYSDRWFLDVDDAGIQVQDGETVECVWLVRGGVQGDPDPAYPANIKKTGKTYSSFPGDDGDLQMGVTHPVPRLTILPNETVRDNLTGLFWTRDAGTPHLGVCSGGNMGFEGAQEYIECLNDKNHLGTDDWRLPTAREFFSLLTIGYGLYPNPNPDPFYNIWGGSYWTDRGSRIGMWNGSYPVDTSGLSYVWPVRGSSGAQCDTVFTVFRTQHAFGNWDIGSQSDPQTFSVTNGGLTDISVSTVALTEDELGAFSLQDNTCDGLLLLPGEGCTFSVRFTPIVRGEHTGLVVITPADPEVRILSVPLSGHSDEIGAVVGDSDLSVTQTVDPENGVPGDDITYTVTVRNNGPSYAPDVDVSFSLPDNADFVSADSTKGSVLSQDGSANCYLGRMDVGETVTITIVVHVVVPGEFISEAILDGVFDDPVSANNTSIESSIIIGEDEYILTVQTGGTGEGTVTGVPGDIDCGVDCTHTVYIPTEMTLTAIPNSGFIFAGWSGGSCSGTGECIFTLEADTTMTAVFADESLPVVSADPIGYYRSLPLLETHSQTYTLENLAQFPSLDIGSVQVTGAASADYTILNDGCTTQGLTFGETCRFELVFSPTSAGPRPATLSLNSNDPVMPVYDIELQGIGWAPSDPIIPATYLPRTGITDSVLPGDDGDIQAGVAWPVPRFTNNGDGTATDRLTGLMWFQDASPTIFRLEGSQAQSIINHVNSGGTYLLEHPEIYTANYTDWRVPSILELESLYNAGPHNPALWLDYHSPLEWVEWGHTQPGGPNVYLSRTSITPYGWEYFFKIRFDTGNVLPWENYYYPGDIWSSIEPLLSYVIPVRSAEPDYEYSAYPARVWKATRDIDNQDIGVHWPFPGRLVSNGDRTVTDNLTGLMWMESANLAGVIGYDPPDATVQGGAMTWEAALEFVNRLNEGSLEAIGGEEIPSHYTDWRLPNRKELLSMVGFRLRFGSFPDPLYNHGYMIDDAQSNYWTSSLVQNGAENIAYQVLFKYGGLPHQEYLRDHLILRRLIEEHWYVWPVRTHLLDSDGDGVYDGLETIAGTDPFDTDSDDDGLTDGNTGTEDLNANGMLDLGETDPGNPDTDGDGILDGTERGLTAPEDPDATDLTAGNFVPDADPSTATDPTDADMDDDGILDGNEDMDQDGFVDPTLGETDPANPDTDGDGILDGTESGLTEPEDPDATDLTAGNFVPDADPETRTDPTDPDSDGDGETDGEEDANQNGAYEPDQGESDPNEGAFLQGDLDLDGDVDRDDMMILLSYRNMPASECEACDMDGDGTITVLDARRLVLLCTCPRCFCPPE